MVEPVRMRKSRENRSLRVIHGRLEQKPAHYPQTWARSLAWKMALGRLVNDGGAGGNVMVEMESFGVVVWDEFRVPVWKCIG